MEYFTILLGVDPTFIFIQLEPIVTGHLLKRPCLVKETMIYPHIYEMLYFYKNE